VPDATPPAKTISKARVPGPLPISVSPNVVPPPALPEISALPPPRMVAPLSTPPLLTTIKPPLLIVAPRATPPEETTRAPLLELATMVLSTTVPVARPPDDTTSTPVFERTVPDCHTAGEHGLEGARCHTVADQHVGDCGAAG